MRPVRPRSPKRSARLSAARVRSPRQGVSDRMTTTATEATTEATPGGVGRVARVIGPVVDVEFAPDEMPEIYNALHVDRELGGETLTLTLEVAQHIGDNLI